MLRVDGFGRAVRVAVLRVAARAKPCVLPCCRVASKFPPYFGRKPVSRVARRRGFDRYDRYNSELFFRFVLLEMSKKWRITRAVEPESISHKALQNYAKNTKFRQTTSIL